MKKTTALKQLLLSNKVDCFLEAHNGVSARIVEEAGFPAIWASSLTISAQHGVRDNNELSWTQALEQCELIQDATTLPVLMDADTGYGNFNSVRRLVKKAEQRGIAGICLEDKCFPKTNSFIKSHEQLLVSMDEFAGKIKAAKDSQSDNDFVVVARTEALVVGQSVDDALERAMKYVEVGADAILLHNKEQDTKQIECFIQRWQSKAPVVLVPTKYYQTPMSVFEVMQISVVIWANHLLRASIAAMQSVAHEIAAARSVAGVEPQLTPLTEVFRLQAVEELIAAEAMYLKKR